jgi:hypothetical protein
VQDRHVEIVNRPGLEQEAEAQSLRSHRAGLVACRNTDGVG